MAGKEFQEHKALRALAHEQWEYDAKLLVGSATIAAVLEKGWIERLPDRPSEKKCRITPAGRDALAAMNAPKTKTPARKPLKMLGSGMKIADLSIAKVRR